MRDTNLVNALREHAEWARANEWETPITLGDDLTEAADRLENQNTHVAAIQQEITKLRGQNKQLREAAALVAKESAELLERNYVMSIIADIRKAGKTWMCQYCAHCKGIVSGMADCDSKKPCVMPYGQFELKRPEPPEVENA
jgi:hypothetical protein